MISKECNYDLILDTNGTGNIIDGNWSEGTYIPDNIWFASGYGCDEVFNYGSVISQPTPFDDKKQTRLGNPYLPGIFVTNLIKRASNN